MILNIAGTSGSGKSHLMRSFLDWAGKRGTIEEFHIRGRGSPLGYDLRLVGFHKAIHVIGSYQTPTGGCDTIRDVEQTYKLIHERYQDGVHVFYEGLFMMNHTRGRELAEAYGDDMWILQLTTPFTVCVRDINSRRAEKGEGVLLDKHNTKNNFVRAQNYCAKMNAAGAHVIRIKREEGLPTMVNLLRRNDHKPAWH